MKTCSKCHEEKPETEFYKTSGLRCKPCHVRACVDSHRRNPEVRRRASKKWYYAKVENRQHSIDKARLWQDRNRERHALNMFKGNLRRSYGTTSKHSCSMEKEQKFKR